MSNNIYSYMRISTKESTDKHLKLINIVLVIKSLNIGLQVMNS